MALKRYTFAHIDKTVYITILASSRRKAWDHFRSTYPLTFKEYYITIIQ